MFENQTHPLQHNILITYIDEYPLERLYHITAYHTIQKVTNSMHIKGSIASGTFGRYCKCVLYLLRPVQC